MTRTPRFDAALDAILADLKPHTRVCTETGESFGITERDIEMMKLLRVPPPKTVWWARIRQKSAFLAGYELFRRGIDGKSVVVMYDPESPARLVEPATWRSDGFDPSLYGTEIDVEAPFFHQWERFSTAVPRPSIVQDERSVNSQWSLYTVGVKNCYFTWGGADSEDMYFSDRSPNCRRCFDVTLCHECEGCYDSVSCNKCYQTYCSERCDGCANVTFCLGCRNCTDCFGCTNLRSRKFCFLNEQLTEQEYRTRLGGIDLRDADVMGAWRDRVLMTVWGPAFRPANRIERSDDVRGEDIQDARSVEGITIWGGERVYHSFGVLQSRDTMDATSVKGLERCYNVTRTIKGFDVKMANSCVSCIDVEYSELLTECEHCFGCIGLKRKKYCIFNKQYVEEGYWPLVDSLKAAMLERGEYGEFFPHRLSPFAYDTSLAHTVYPATREDAARLGMRWYDFAEETSEVAEPLSDLPKRLEETPDVVLDRRFRCERTGRAFGFVRPQLVWHRSAGLALPREHHTARRMRRMAQLFPPRLYVRACDMCRSETFTRIPPSVTSPVLCGACYEQVVLGEKPAPVSR